MRRLLLGLLFIVFVAQTCFGAVETFSTDIDARKTYRQSPYRFTAKPKDKFYDWCQEVQYRIEGNTANYVFYFDKTDTVPTASEGMVYYDDSENALKVYNGSSWGALGTDAGNSLDSSYNNGSKIEVDGDVLELEVDDGSNNSALHIDHDEATNDNTAFLLENAADAANAISIDIDAQTTGRDIEGTGASWYVSGAGALTCVGITNNTGDVLFNDTYDVQWDTSADTMKWLDNALIGIGGALSGTSDLTIKGDGTNVLVEVATEDAADLIFGSTNALDIKMCGGTATKYVLFDQSDPQLEFVDVDIAGDDNFDLIIGADAEWNIDNSSETLRIIPSDTDDDFAIHLGHADYTSDLKIFGKTASTVEFDASGDKVTFNAYDIAIGDGDIIEWGDSTDHSMAYDGTKNQLELYDAGDDSDVTLQILGGEAKEARLILAADGDDDATDQWQLSVDTSGVLAFGNDAVADTFTDYVSIAATTGAITLKEAEVISNNTDDTVSVTSNDNDMTFLILGNANAKSAILDLSADAAANDVDTWLFTVADGGALTIANDSTATMTVQEAVDFTSTITLADDELLSNASDIVDITGDDAATTFAIRGANGNFSGVLEISSDDASDDADTWLFTVADGGAMTIANDGTATMTIQEAVAVTSTITLANAEVFANDADDEVSFTSDDNHTTFAVRGNANAKSAILELSGDDAADDVDTWLFTVADGGAMTIANDSTATMTINEVVALGSGMTSIPVVVTNAAGYTVTAANSGRVHLIGDLSQNCTIDLPAEAAGLYYIFVYAGGSADAHDHTIDSEAAANYFKGGISFWDTDAGAGGDETHAGIYSDEDSNSKLTLNNPAAGTEVHFYCQDGTLWYVWGQVLSDTAPAFADQ